MTLRVHFTNFDYFAQQTFTSLEDAIAYGKQKCFEFSVWPENMSIMLASWSPIGGLRNQVETAR